MPLNRHRFSRKRQRRSWRGLPCSRPGLASEPSKTRLQPKAFKKQTHPAPCSAFTRSGSACTVSPVMQSNSIPLIPNKFPVEESAASKLTIAEPYDCHTTAKHNISTKTPDFTATPAPLPSHVARPKRAHISVRELCQNPTRSPTIARATPPVKRVSKLVPSDAHPSRTTNSLAERLS